jgi:hypothetical protein
MSATEGDCGSVDGRGILFDLYVLPVENILQSCAIGQLMFVQDSCIDQVVATYCHGGLRS